MHLCQRDRTAYSVSISFSLHQSQRHLDFDRVSLESTYCLRSLKGKHFPDNYLEGQQLSSPVRVGEKDSVHGN